MPIGLQDVYTGTVAGDRTGTPGRNCFTIMNNNSAIIEAAMEDAELKAFVVKCVGRDVVVVPETSVEWWRQPYAFVLLEVRAACYAAGGDDIVVDVMQNGTSVQRSGAWRARSSTGCESMSRRMSAHRAALASSTPRPGPNEATRSSTSASNSSRGRARSKVSMTSWTSVPPTTPTGDLACDTRSRDATSCTERQRVLAERRHDAVAHDREVATPAGLESHRGKDRQAGRDGRLDGGLGLAQVIHGLDREEVDAGFGEDRGLLVVGVADFVLAGVADGWQELARRSEVAGDEDRA